MFAFITFLVSILTLSLIMFGTKVQRKTRKTISDYWCYYDWETTSDRPKWPVYFIILNYIVSVIPVANIVWTGIVIWYICKLYNDSGYANYGGKLIIERIIFSNKFIDWLNKEI